MNELSLFTGGGGGVIASKYLLGWRTIGYVEWEKYPQEIIKARIRDGYLDAAPIFGDIDAFISEGYADAYKGMVDVLAAGFPCQPFSTAGANPEAERSEKNRWPQTLECIRIIRPRELLLENVPNLLTFGYSTRIFADLAALGYVGRNIVLSAAGEGAPHLRERLWIYGYSNSDGESACAINEKAQRMQELVANANSAQCQGARVSGGIHQEHSDLGRSTWWDAEPDVHRVDDGVDFGMDRLKAIGNGQCSIVAARAWQVLA